jgi:fructose-1-phosphate kinase PfkB-like protein
VIVTLGRDGAVTATPDGGWWARPPDIQAVSPVGSGDSLLAGVTVALLDGLPFAEALRLGVACGAANTLTIGTGNIRLADVAAIREQIALQPLA